MTRILLSLLTIAAVVGLSTAATLAYFTSTATLADNVVVSGTASVYAKITDLSGNLSGLSTNGTSLSPGQSFTRCLWILNNGSVASRFKVYRSSEPIGTNTDLGNKLNVSATINPASGDCDGTVPAAVAGGTWTKAAISGTRAEWNNVAMRGPLFSNLANTPFTLLTSDAAIDPQNFVVYALKVALDPTADNTVQNASYTSELTVFGMQKEGSDPGILDWNPIP